MFRIRNPRIFFPLTTSTSTVTKTANVWTVCFRSTTTAVTTCGRKKRMITEVLEDIDQLVIQPSDSLRLYILSLLLIYQTQIQYFILVRENGAERDIDSLIEDGIDEDADDSRDPRFMIYWTTIVTTSFTTSYTASSFIASVTCTPSGFPYSLC